MTSAAPSVLFQQAMQHHRAERWAEAAALYRRVVEAEPANVPALGNWGIVCQRSGNLAQAAECFRRISELQPRNAQAFNHLGMTLGMAGRYAQAVDALTIATRLDPNEPSAQFNHGLALSAVGRLAEAIAAMQRAVELAPDQPQYVHVLAAKVRDVGRLTHASQLCERALARFPNDAYLHNLVGTIRHAQGDAEAAIAEYRTATKLDVSLAEAQHNLLLALHYRDADPREVFREHVRWGATFATPTTRHANDTDPDRRLRVGYVSPDLRRHAVANLLEAPLRSHDRRQVEVFVYNDAADIDDITARLRPLADVCRDSAGISHEQLFKLIIDDRIDILIDCAAHTTRNRLALFALKPAPVQVTMLGYPNTTGLGAIDYRITDKLADPPGLADELHVERLARIAPPAWCYAPPVDAPAVKIERAQGGVRFGCFNILAKITPDWMDVWRRILSGVPGSKLIVKNASLRDEGTVRLVAERFAGHGIDAAQLELLAPQRQPAEHLDVYNRIDVALDTFPYHGTTTTCDALWMGTPLVTMAGRTHASRVGLSLLSAVGLNDLVATTPAQYEHIAVRLADDAARRRELHATLRERMRASPLMDGPLYARKLESAYRDMWRRWCAERSADE